MVARSLPEPLRELRRSAAAIPALVMVAVFVALAAAGGGYFPTAFLPAALFALALLAVALLSISTRAAVPRTVMLAFALFAAYAAWSYLSILWAVDQGAAWEGANRALMYAVVFALFALWPLRALPATAVLGAFGLGVAALGLVTLLRAGAADDVSEMFVYGRFVEPVGYTNGNAALWSLALIACLFLAARREVAAPLRGLALGGAGLLTGLALLAQSRGWAVALPLTAIALLAIVPGRARSAVVIALVAVAVIPILDPVLGVYEGFQDDLSLEPPMSSAATAILISSVLLVVLGTALAVADRRVEVRPEVARRGRLATAIGGALVTVVAIVALLVAIGDPIDEASAAWDDFRAGTDAGEQAAGDSRFTSAAGQNRWDYWGVGLSQFSGSPLTGEGTGSFQNAYLREGDTVQRPRFPHSLEVRLLSETGLIGALLFAGAVAAALVAGGRAVRLRSELGAAAAGTGTVIFLYWAIHGSIEWFYELPALAAPAFAMLGLATALTPRARIAESRRPGSSTLVGGRPGVAALVAIGVGLGGVLAAPWLSALQVDAAIDGWQEDRSGALERLDSAARLDPLSVDPHSAAAAISLRLGEPRTARQEFEAVLERDPDDAYAHFQLGALASQRGERGEALALLRRGAELSPQDRLIATALEDVRSGARLDANETYDAVLARRSSLTAAP